MPMTVGVIGYGRFGRLAARIIARHASVLVYDRRGISPRLLSRRIRLATLAKTASQQIVLLAVPASSLRNALRSIAPFIRQGALVLDVCAVKAEPVRWMKRLLPRHAHILGTHPLFGPDTAARSLRGLGVVFCPVRIPRRLLGFVRRAARRKGLRVRIMTPDRHDRMIAQTILVTQYVGRLVDGANLRRWEGVTESYARLLALVDVARHDTPLLYSDLLRYNRHAPAVDRALGKAGKRLHRV